MAGRENSNIYCGSANFICEYGDLQQMNNDSGDHDDDESGGDNDLSFFVSSVNNFTLCF